MTANYTFSARADDYMVFEMSKNASVDFLEELILVKRYSWSYFFENNGQLISNPVFLEAGKRYYTRVRHIEWNGGDWFNIRMIIHNPSLKGEDDEEQQISSSYRGNVPEVQTFSLQTDIRREIQHIFINATSGWLFVIFSGTFLLQAYKLQ